MIVQGEILMERKIYLVKDKKELQNEKRKYYLVDADKIRFIDNDDNFVYLDSYFDRNNVSEQYRKAFLQIIPLKYKSIEFITGVEFDTTFLSDVSSLAAFLKPYVHGNSNLVKTAVQDDIGYAKYEGITFNADIKSKQNYNYIINFLKSVRNSDELERYIGSITSFIADGIACTKERRIINSLNNYDLYGLRDNCIEINIDYAKKRHLV